MRGSRRASGRPNRWMRSDHRCRPASSSSGTTGDELLVKMTSEVVPRSDLPLQVCGVVGAESICTGLMISPSPSALMTHKIDPTVKIWPGFGEDEEPAKCTILFVMETTCTPLPGAPTFDRISSAVLRGVSHKGRLIGRSARNQEQEGNRDTRVRQVQAISTT